MSTSRLSNLWQLYSANEDRCTALWLRQREQLTDPNRWKRAGYEDSETLRILDDAGLRLLRQIVTDYGGDAAQLEAEVDARYAEDAPLF